MVFQLGQSVLFYDFMTLMINFSKIHKVFSCVGCVTFTVMSKSFFVLFSDTPLFSDSPELTNVYFVFSGE